MNRLAHIPSTANVVLITATTATFPPTTYGLVPTTWGSVAAGHPPEFDLDFTAAGAATFTDIKLYGATLVAGAIADDTFTAANATEIMTATSHGLLTGDGPVQLTNSGGALPAGLSLATDYWIIRIDANTFYFAASLADALAGTKVFITGDGTGTHTLSDTSATQLVRWRWHGAVTIANQALASIREGYTLRFAHNPQVIAYAPVWTGTAANAVTVTMTPVMNR